MKLHSKTYEGSFLLFDVFGNNPAGVASFIFRYFANLSPGLFKAPQLPAKLGQIKCMSFGLSLCDANSLSLRIVMLSICASEGSNGGGL